MKFHILLAAVLSTALAFGAAAQTARQLIEQKPERAGGVYYAYPVDEIAPDYGSKAPKGYKPFYVSHFGRHGSRYLINDADYTKVMKVLDKAHDNGALTPRGELLRLQMDTIWEEARGRGGELSPLGNRQHKGIARRMATAYPQVFAGDARVTAASTTVMRCAHSMFSFIEGLKELNPQLEIPRESGQRTMEFVNHGTKRSAQMGSHEGPYYQELRRFREKNTRPERLVSSIFSKPEWVQRWLNESEFMWDLYWVAVDLQNMETKINLLPLFTTDELYGLWQCFNFQFYATNSSYPLADGAFLERASFTIKHMVDTADDYIANGSHGATLRFGHDGNIVPLTALLGIEGCSSNAIHPEDLAKDYADFKVSPMCSNIQLVFFRKDGGNADDILVRIYHNERNAHLPLPVVDNNYYRWSDLRPYLAARAAKEY